MSKNDPASIETLLLNSTPHTLELYHHFITQFQMIGTIRFHPAKTMIGIGTPEKRVAWIIKLGKNFMDVVFPFPQPYTDNLCFRKIAQVPGTHQFNHHLRVLFKEDINEEVIDFMKKAVENGH